MGYLKGGGFVGEINMTSIVFLKGDKRKTRQGESS